jgi:transcriptional regulator with XRE-family HTH domain
MTFGEKLRQLRQRRKLTQRKLAEKAGVDFSYISKIENDRMEHTPSVKTIRKFAAALDADELELMDAANKIPIVLESIAGDEHARRFFRRATEQIKTSEGWQDLLDYLERKST